MLLANLLENRPLTLSVGAWLLAVYPPHEWENVQEYEMVRSGVAAVQTADLPAVPAITKERRDPRIPSPVKESGSLSAADQSIIVKIYSDYADVLQYIPSTRFSLVETQDEADVALLVGHVGNFLKLPKHLIVCQFPYEGGFVRKDLLPLTVRRFCYHLGKAPYWWLPCFDLSTEFQYFASEFNNRLKTGMNNSWIVKPAQGTRGLGHKIFFNTAETPIGLYQIARVCSPLSTAGGDKVAQELVEFPLLALSRKFDLRVYIIVRSFEPFEAYMHKYFYARLANKTYSKASLDDPEVGITVSAYDSDERVAARQERLTFDELRHVLLKEQWGIDENEPNYLDAPAAPAALQWWKQILENLEKMVTDVFRGISKSVGRWPNSRAYYAVDIILDNSIAESRLQHIHEGHNYSSETLQIKEENIPIPKLIEINFMGDWHGVEAAIDGNPRFRDTSRPGDKFNGYTFANWCQDLLISLATNDVLCESKFFRLNPEVADSSVYIS
jgi:hypothetical protein